MPALPAAMLATISRPAPPWSQRHRHVFAVLIALDQLASALTGGAAHQTISSRLGFSMEVGGWASRVAWPAWWRRHCIGAEERVSYVHPSPATD